MHRTLIGAVGLWTALVMAMAPAAGEEKVARADLGKTVKLRILVDKVMQPEAHWVTQEWMVRAAAEAGFNVYSPRVGHDRLDEVDRVTAWCEKYGIYHMPWMRGSLAAPGGDAAAGKRMVWASGVEQPLWSPNSDEFWQWTSRYIVEYAKRAAKNEHLLGVFLDYENYAPGRVADLYSLSYDDVILERFAHARGIEIPPLELAARKPWLEKHGLHEAFGEFQIAHWRQRCRTLREAVDRYCPAFQFCLYPAPGTPFMVRAVYPQWSTRAAPLILADASVYGRPSRLMPQADALAANRRKLLERMKIPQAAGIPFLYTGGIDPVVRGADPEFSGKNAVMISALTDGYWIFYEGPTYTKPDHAQYWKWFTWANRAIGEGDFAAWKEPRQTPEDWGFAAFSSGGNAPLAAPPWDGRVVELPAVKLRQENLLLLGCRAGRAVEIVLHNRPFAHYQASLIWEVRTPLLEKVAGGVIPHGQSGPIRFQPKQDGVYLLAASAGGCAYSVQSANVPVGLYAGESLHLLQGAQRLFFHLCEGAEGVKVTIRGAGAETVRATLLRPDGEAVATAQTTLRQSQAQCRAAAVAGAGRAPWALELAKADEGTLEDVSVRLEKGAVPVLSLLPEHAFRWGPPGAAANPN